MILAVISDSHDRIDVLAEIVEELNEADMVLHAGDLISPFVLRTLEKVRTEIHAVYGNNDGDKRTLYEWGLKYGVRFHGDFLVMDELGLFMSHNTEAYREALIKSGRFRIIIGGHTHRAEIRKEGETLFVNPGELCGYLTEKRTYAIVDVEEREAKIIEL
ncbi:MAG: metallophosphoesterase [Archaeoglobi archaeon]|nr:metallophosphoesterase [Candidatus Mnemosynella sp.]